MKRRGLRQKGQSLVELALVAPLFALFLVFCQQIAGILLCKMELASICREAALARGRMMEDSPQACQRLARQMAAASGRLDPQQLEVTLGPVFDDFSSRPQAGQDSLGLGGLASLFLNKLVGGLMAQIAGEKIEATYHYRMPGLAGLAFPHGLELHESIVSKSGFWQVCFSC